MLQDTPPPELSDFKVSRRGLTHYIAYADGLCFPKDTTPSPEPAHPPYKDTATKLSILLLMSSASIPAALGALLLLSIGLGAARGSFSPSYTFTRPVEEGLNFNLTSLHVDLSPLLISSIASSSV